MNDIGFMANSEPPSVSRVSLDAFAIHAFVRDMIDAVENVSFACISAKDGHALWSQTYENSEIPSSYVIPKRGRRPSRPVNVALDPQRAAYHYPLDCDNIDGTVFSLVINSADPPNLASVSYGIEPMLKCLERQIDLDCTLTTTKLVVSPRKPAETFAKLLQSLSDDGDLQSSFERLAQSCLKQCAIEAIAIAIPERRIKVIHTKSSFSQQSALNLLTKLHAPLAEKRRLISAKLTLEDGSEGHAVCAPIMQNRKSIQGVIYIVSASHDGTFSNIVRAIANHVSALPALTQVQSRLLTRLELTAKINDICRSQPTMPHSLIYFDSDKMHTINDAFGYSGGDRALERFRRILSDSAGANDLLAHLGSDRFAMFMPGASGDTAVSKAAQILRLLSQESIDDSDKSINLSASAGVVDNQAASKGAEDMLILSEVAARGAQDRGGNQCALFQDIDSSIIQRRSDVDKVGFLQMALIENQFVLHAQRIQALDADDGQKFELLARLKSDKTPDRSPAEFLSAAERYQLMTALDRWVINSALNSIASAENTLEVSLATFSINVSAQSLQDDSFIEFVESRIAETGVAHDALCFELTETSLVKNIDRAQRFVHRVQRLGCQVALDDFGTGYSSFSYLKTLPVNYLKVDGAFVRDILENELSKTIVTSVVSIADVIGAQTVAEHVENSMVQAWLKNAGVHFVQGFAIHKPEPFDEILAQMDSLAGIFEPPSYLDLRPETSPAAQLGQGVPKLA